MRLVRAGHSHGGFTVNKTPSGKSPGYDKYGTGSLVACKRQVAVERWRRRLHKLVRAHGPRGRSAGKNALGVMRLDPALEKPRGNRKADAFVLDAFQIHPRKPARIDIFSDARPQPAFHTRPTILFRICHCLRTFLKECLLTVKLLCVRAAQSRPQARLPVSAMDRPFGGEPSVRSLTLRKRSRG